MKITTLKTVSTLMLLLNWIIASIAAAAEDCELVFEPATGSYGFLQEQMPQQTYPADASVGEIHFTRLPIFDETNPAENNLLFRLANRIHIMTKGPTVSQQLLFDSGQAYSSSILEESSRLLREQRYLYDADIRPIRHCNERIDVEVITKDNWTLSPNFSFDRSGGENAYSFGLRDSNLLGLGKLLSVGSSSDIDRRSSELTYEDNNVLGSRVTNVTTLIDSDDGFTRSFELALPFFSLDSRQSWSVRIEDIERQDEQYFRGDDVSEVEHNIEDFELEYGFSQGLVNGTVKRWSIGYRYRNDEFGIGDELPPPVQFPDDKELSTVYFEYEAVQDYFDTAFNLDQIYRTEDIHLGYHLSNRFGVAADAFGSDQDRLVLEGFFSDTLFFNDDVLWQHLLEWEGLWNLDEDVAEDVEISYETRYYRRQTDNRSFFASLEAVYSKHLNGHRQILLGGLSGARAFDNRFQVGDRSLLLTLEERLYTDIHLWNLVRVGGALFIDVGRAWEPGFDNGVEDDLLANIGVGLRLASSKAGSGRIAHIDFSFPLTNRSDRDVRDLQVSFNVKSRF
ncbi:MAG TPA: hypothetical protein DCM64_10820 [Gammaproteobacteria bacterium]|nr:hypothetical protein [Gammaproteobacteria bacterium]